MDRFAQGLLLCQRSRRNIERARTNLLRARALAIQVSRTRQATDAIRRENRLIRGRQR